MMKTAQWPLALSARPVALDRRLAPEGVVALHGGLDHDAGECVGVELHLGVGLVPTGGEEQVVVALDPSVLLLVLVVGVGVAEDVVDPAARCGGGEEVGAVVASGRVDARAGRAGNADLLRRGGIGQRYAVRVEYEDVPRSVERRSGVVIGQRCVASVVLVALDRILAPAPARMRRGRRS